MTKIKTNSILVENIHLFHVNIYIYILLLNVCRLNSVEWLNHWIDTWILYLLDRFCKILNLWFWLRFNQIPIQSNTLANKYISRICNLLHYYYLLSFIIYSIAVRSIVNATELYLLDEKHFWAKMNMCFKFNFLNCSDKSR